MAYQSLYRKYRPQTFADVVGQGHVTRTLQNAWRAVEPPTATCLPGRAGPPKTTVARLLAKALNCQSSNVPTAEPCNKCEACLTITAGSCMDVIEMDAASHRGVSDIEEVRKSVGYGPMEMRYKVFIIDEAHQLSSDAKDAFLKTLEEPPANVVFILATTEPQSIPITIRSRCQQFDFKRGSLQDIAARLKYVLDCEGVTYAPEAINLVARGAEGSYRDSLSLLGAGTRFLADSYQLRRCRYGARDPRCRGARAGDAGGRTEGRSHRIRFGGPASGCGQRGANADADALHAFS
jgi:DNA polymerase-3 subunit gamma/tau